jgi:hypothetical protein
MPILVENVEVRFIEIKTSLKQLNPNPRLLPI